MRAWYLQLMPFIWLYLVSSKRVAFLPDVSIGGEGIRWFYPNLMSGATRILHGTSKFHRGDQEVYCSMNFLDMPNIYESNTKRYEIEWLRYMRDQLDLSSYDVVIGHGSSAEAMLRYMEQGEYTREGCRTGFKPLKAAVALDAIDIYTAGERHGRQFHYGKIRRMCLTDHVIIAGTTKYSIENSKELYKELYQRDNDDNDHNVDDFLDHLQKEVLQYTTMFGDERMSEESDMYKDEYTKTIEEVMYDYSSIDHMIGGKSTNSREVSGFNQELELDGSLKKILEKRRTNNRVVLRNSAKKSDRRSINTKNREAAMRNLLDFCLRQSLKTMLI